MAMASGTEPVRRTGRRGIFSWMLFDWAAQPFHTLIVTFIFGPYFTAYVAENAEQGQALWGYAAGTAGLVIAVLAPFLGAVADASGPRKPWIALFGVFIVIGTSMLYMAAPGGAAPVALVLVGFGIGLIGVEFAGVFVNSMMPSLVARSELGKLSGSGWAIGYVGGLLTLLFALGFLSANDDTGLTIIGLPPIFGLDPVAHEGDRAVGPFTAIWFVIFVIPLFLFTKDVKRPSGARVSLGEGLRRIRASLARLPGRRSYAAFLGSSMIYRDGLNALYAFGGIYAVGVLGLSIIEVGIFGILANIAGTVGAFTGGRMDARFGPKRVVFVSCWLLVAASMIIVSTTQESFLFVIAVTSETLPVTVFYLAGAMIGAAGGALQAADRTLLVDQVSPEETTEAFGLYALTGRATSFIGPYAVGIVTMATQSQRIGIMPVIGLLAIGALGLFFVRDKGGRGEG